MMWKSIKFGGPNPSLNCHLRLERKAVFPLKMIDISEKGNIS